MPTSQEPSPYPIDPNDQEGRVAIISTNVDQFTVNTAEPAGGLDKTIPYENETAHGDDGEVYVLMRDKVTNKVVLKSHSKELEARFDALEATGIFKDAGAFRFNRQIYKIYFDTARNTVKAIEEYVFPSTYRYWAIRALGFNSEGNPTYYSGILSGTGTVLSNLIDMQIKTGDDGQLYSTPGTGNLIKPMDHAQNYVVEFYDSDKILVDSKSFQAVSIRYLTFDMTPDVAIQDIKITSNYPYEGDPNAVLLHQGQDYQDLALRVYVQYAGDNNYKDVTHEQYVGSKLIVDGLENIDSTYLTDATHPAQTFTIIYYLSQATTTNPNVVNNNGTLSITKTISVYIVPDIGEVPYSIFIGGWLEDVSSLTDRMLFKVYGKYTSGSVGQDSIIREITPLVKQSVFTNFSYDQTRMVFMNNGTDISTSIHDFDIQVPYGTASQKSFHFKMQGEVSNRRIKYSVGDSSTQLFEYEEVRLTTNSGQKRFSFDPNYSVSSQPYTKAGMINRFSFKQNGANIAPTHFMIRHGRNPSFAVTSGYIRLDDMNNQFNVIENASNLVIDKTPLIVEFYKVIEVDGVYTYSMCTGANIFYANLQSI
jgi:hypothetical protein